MVLRFIERNNGKIQIDMETRRISSYVPVHEVTADRCKNSFVLQQELCPYKINFNHSAYNIYETALIFNWIRDNLKGNWFYILQNNYGFELAEDAVAFKLFWTKK